MKNDTISMSDKRRSRTKKVVALLVSLMVLLTLATGVTIAYMFLDTNPVTNTFTAATEASPQIVERVVDLTKHEVKVNVGKSGYAVYVRAKVVINWTNADGAVLAVTPPVEDQDYTIVYNPDGAWQYSDGFWYYKEPISSGETKQLISECTVIGKAPIAGYTLQVDILTQTIQAAGTTDNGMPAVTDAWGIDVDDDGNLVVPSSSGDEPSGQ